MKFFSKLFFASLVVMSFVLTGCDKEKPYDITTPPALAHFLGQKNQLYNVDTDPAPPYTITIGTTTVSNTARTVVYNISSPTGAQAGVQYTVTGGGTVTIPADSARVSIVVQADYAQYETGRKDTLIFSLAKPSIDIAEFQDSIVLILKGCDEATPDLASLENDYANTNETLGTSTYGPYTTSISSVTSTSPTTATIVVENIFDNGWGPISFDIDWTDPLNRTLTVVQQDAVPGSDAGDLNPTYAGNPIAVRQFDASGPGTYSACDETFTLNIQLGVFNNATGTVLGYFPVLYEVILGR